MECQAPGVRVLSFSDDDEVEGAIRALLERHGDVVLTVLDVCDRVALEIIGAGRGGIDENASKVPAKNFQFGSCAVGVRVACGRGRDNLSLLIDELSAHFAGRGVADRVLDAHTTGDDATGPANIDVLTPRSEAPGNVQ
jgi:hypothetical protein